MGQNSHKGLKGSQVAYMFTHSVTYNYNRYTGMIGASQLPGRETESFLEKKDPENREETPTHLRSSWE
jgi:hypothetical protein